MWRRFKPLLVLVGVVLGLMLLSMLVIPWQIKQQASRWIAEHTSRKLSFERVFFNPFNLTVEADGVRLTEPDGERTFASLKHLRLSASGRSILHRAVIFDQVELQEPFVNIELLGEQRYNFSDFLPQGQPPEPEEPEDAGKPLLFSLNNIVISDGSIDFADQASKHPSRHQIRELSLAVPFIGNIPYLTDKYVEPVLRLLLNGAEVRAEGQLKPFAASLETSLALVFQGVDLAYYAALSPVPLPVKVATGMLDSDLALDYRVSEQQSPELTLRGELRLAALELREPAGEPLLQLPLLTLDIDRAELLQREALLRSVTLERPQLFLRRDKEGLWNLARMATGEKSPPPKKEASEKTPRWSVEEVQLHGGTVQLRDELPAGGIREELQAIELQLRKFSNRPQVLGAMDLSLHSDRGSQLEVSGEIGLQPFSTRLKLQAGDLPLLPYAPYLEPWLTAPIEGSLDLGGELEYTAEGNLLLHHARLGLKALKLPFAGKDHFTLGQLAVSGVDLDLGQRQLKVADIQLKGGDLRATRLADGSLSPRTLLRAAAAQPAPKTEPVPKADWTLQLGQLQLEQINLLLTDAGRPQSPQLKVTGLALQAEQLHYPESAQSPFKLSGKIDSKGSFAANGSLAHTPLRLQAQTRIKSLTLADFNDFIPERVALKVKDGELFATLDLRLDQQRRGLSGSLSGRANLSGFNLRDSRSDGELLAWDSLDLTGIRGEIAPLKLAVEEVALSNYRANILINEQGQVNLTTVAGGREQAAGPTPDPAEPEADQPAATAEPPPDISIAALTLQGGTVHFTDRHLSRTFATTMYQLGGRISGLSSDAAMQADVDLRGQLENHSPLTVTGKLNPLSQELFADLTIRFQDIDLAPMSPYSGTYLGRIIDKGKLYLDLSYHIEDQRLRAENKIMLDQFTLGEAVESDKATSLPVSLAIALLKDRKGEIHLDVPLSGNLNDPEFSVWGAVFSILKNLVVKAATSPFSLLASLAGGGEDFSSVEFAPGSARLEPAQTEQLAKLAEMLVQRPGLTLEVSGFIDPQKDPEGLRQQQLQAQLVAAKWRELKENGEAPPGREAVEVAPQERSKYLQQVYKEADFPRPRNFVGLLKALPDEEMTKLLLANTPAGPEQMAELARERALKVREALETLQPELKPQIFLTQADITTAAKTGPASRVEFKISSK